MIEEHPVPVTVVDRRAVRRTATDLVLSQGPSAVTIGSLCLRTGIPRELLTADFPAVSDVYGDILRTVLDTHLDHAGRTLMRRRSLTQSLTELGRASWTVVGASLDDHRALAVLSLSEASQPGLVSHRQPDQSIHSVFTTAFCEVLGDVERTHDIVWDLPVDQLAVHYVGAMFGQLMEYVTRSDQQRINRMIDTMSFDLAQYGRRRAKNQKY